MLARCLERQRNVKVGKGSAKTTRSRRLATSSEQSWLSAVKDRTTGSLKVFERANKAREEHIWATHNIPLMSGYILCDSKLRTQYTHPAMYSFCRYD